MKNAVLILTYRGIMRSSTKCRRERPMTECDEILDRSRTKLIEMQFAAKPLLPCDGSFLDERFELTGLEHLGDDVAAAD